MARPTMCRRICQKPKYDMFIPGARSVDVSDGLCGDCGNMGAVELTLDELETIRLMDCERRTHDQCAKQMGISRTTVTEIYGRARSKVADCLVNGKALIISGGNYRLCDGSAGHCCEGKCCRREVFLAKQRNRSAVEMSAINNDIKGRKEEKMRIAVTYDSGSVFQHFGHTEQFKLYDVEKGNIENTQIVSAAGSGHGALAGFLKSLKVDAIICGGIGGGAQTALARQGIQLYGGVSGNADDAVNALIAGNLSYSSEASCSHHDHDHDGAGGHNCGSHGCGGGGKCHG